MLYRRVYTLDSELQFREATDQVKAALEKNPSDPVVIITAAVHYARMEKFPLARSYVDQIPSEFLDDPRLLMSIAPTLVETGSAEKAIQSLEKALGILGAHGIDEPTLEIDIRHNLKIAYIKAGLPDKAKAEFSRIQGIERNANFDHYLDKMSALYAPGVLKIQDWLSFLRILVQEGEKEAQVFWDSKMFPGGRPTLS